MSMLSLVCSDTAFSAVHWISVVSSRMTIRSSGAAVTISAMMALASVVLPDPVPPEITMLNRDSMALRMTAACSSVITIDFGYSANGIRREARRRMVNVGPDTTGGNSPSKRCPPIGSSPEMIGRSMSASDCRACATLPITISAAAGLITPAGATPCSSRSINSRPSGLSMISTTVASSSAMQSCSPRASSSLRTRRGWEASRIMRHSGSDGRDL